MTRTQWSDTEISAYLDGELTPRDHEKLQAEIARDPNLQQRVATMEQIVSLVQAVPLRRTPRNYLLTPSMVAEKEPEPVRRRRPLWAMRLATSLVAAAFIVTFGLTLLQQGVTPRMAMQSRDMPAASLMKESERVDEVAPAAPNVGAQGTAQRMTEAPEAAVEEAPEAAEALEAPMAEMTEEETAELTPEEEMAFAPMEEAGDGEETADAVEGMGVGGGGEPGEGSLEVASEPPTPEDEISDATAPEAEVEAEAPEEPAAAMAVETPAEAETAPEETSGTFAAAPETTDDASKADGADTGTAPEMPPPGAPQVESGALNGELEGSTRRRGVPVSLTVGLGIATVVLTIVTVWLSRRRLG